MGQRYRADRSGLRRKLSPDARRKSPTITPSQPPPVNAARALERRKRIKLTMLSWFLRENLPLFLPTLFVRRPKVTPFHFQGISNYVFLVEGHRRKQYLVRMKHRASDDSGAGLRQGVRWSDYHKEAWIMDHLPAEVPTPGIIKQGIGYVEGSGEIQRYAYMIQPYLPYVSAHSIEKEIHKSEFLRRIGRIARHVNTTPTIGFGREFLEDARFAFPTWKAYLENELKECRLATLADSGKLTTSDCRRVERRIERLGDLHVLPTLFHSDMTMNWGNLLVDDEHQIRSVIDWEFAGAGMGVHQELAVSWYVLYRDGVSDAEQGHCFKALLDGYGISEKKFRDDYADEVGTFILMHAINKFHRYLKMEQDGLLVQPWRIEFARRCHVLVKNLAASLSGGPVNCR